MKTALNNIRRWITNKRLLIVGVLFLVVVINAFVIWYVLAEKTVYYWDYSGYWTSAIDLTNAFSSDFQTGIKVFLASLRTDYNFLPVLPISFMMQAFGTERLVYILSVLNLYLIPFGLIVAYLASRWLYGKVNAVFFLAVAAVAIMLPASLNPMLEGLPDVVGLLLLSIMALIFTRLDIFSRIDLRVLLLSIVLALFIVVRRWYAFWVVAALVGLLIAGCYYLWRRSGKQFGKAFFTSLYWPVVNLIVLGLVTLFIIVWLFPYTLEAFTVNYRDIYSAYSAGGLGHSLWALITYFGVVVLASSIVGYGRVFLLKKHQARRPAALFFAVCTTVAFFAFTRTQDFGPHHYYLLVPGILFGLIYSLEWLVSLGRNLLTAGVVGAWLAMLLLSSFVLVPTGPIAYARTYLLGNSNPPIVRTDMGQLRALARYVENSPTYVVASSGTFNESVLRNINLPGPYVNNILPSAHIDKRDGFPNVFFIARYIVVASPIQTHMQNNGQGQLVVTEIAREILDGKATNLQYIKSFIVEQGVELRVYERMGEYDAAFISHLREVFSHEYGEYEKLIKIGEEYL